MIKKIINSKKEPNLGWKKMALEKFRKEPVEEDVRLGRLVNAGVVERLKKEGLL
jgi:hypothetical protein